jgi:subtilisin family serine protease
LGLRFRGLYALYTALVFLLLTPNIWFQPISAKIFEAPLPILSDYGVNDAPTFSNVDGSKDYVRVLVRLSGSDTPNLPDGSRITRRYSIIPYVAAEVPVKRLNEVKGLSVQADRVFSLQMLKQAGSGRCFEVGVNYPHLGSYPTLLNETTHLIRADEVWVEGYRGRGVIIAIIDTGIDKNHPDLDDLDDDPLTDDPKVLAEVAFLPGGSNDTSDAIGHGTFVASVAAGTGASGSRGFKATFASTKALNATIIPHTQRGVAPEAYLYNIKVFNESGLAYESDIIAGIEWAVEHGADVINLSLGATPNSPSSEDPLAQAIEAAVRRNVVVTVAAGNSGPGLYSILTPAIAPSAISVGAVYETGEVTYFSSRGPAPFDLTCKPDLLAFGAAVIGANAFYAKKDEPAYVEMWGTSASAPQAAGAAALLIQAFPGISAVGVKAALMKGAKPLAVDPMFQGAGLLDVKGAFEAARRANFTQRSFSITYVVKDPTPHFEFGDPLLGARVLLIGSDHDFKILVNILRERGASPTILPADSNLSNVSLKNFDLLIIPQPVNLSSLAYNISLIHRFVAEGGSLLFIGDLRGKEYSRFTEPYGIRWDNVGAGGFSTKLSHHPLTTNVSALFFGNPTASLIVSGRAEVVAYDPFYIGVACWEDAEKGSKVVVIADDDLLNDRYINASDNKIFALNALRWLVTQHGQPKVKVHEVGVRLKHPIYALNQSEVELEVEVVNFGAYEENVSLKIAATLSGRTILNETRFFFLEPASKTSFQQPVNVSVGRACGQLSVRFRVISPEKDSVASNNEVEANILIVPKLVRSGISPNFAILTPQRIDSFTAPLIALYPNDFKILRLSVFTTEPLDASLEIRGNVTALASFSKAPQLTMHHKVGEEVDPVPYLYTYGSEYSIGCSISLGNVAQYASEALQIIIPSKAELGVYEGEVLLKNASSTLASTKIVIEVRHPRARAVFDDVFQGFIQGGVYYPIDVERLAGGSFQGLDVFGWWRVLSEDGVDVDSLWQALHDRGSDDAWSIFLSGEYDIVVLHDTELHNYRRSLLPSILESGVSLIIHLDVGFESASLKQFALEERQNFINGFLQPRNTLPQIGSEDLIPLYSALTLTLDEESVPLATANTINIPGSSGVVMAAYTSKSGGRLIVLGDSNLYEVPDDFTWLYFKLLFDVNVERSAWAKLALAEVDYALPKPPTLFSTALKS